jgi:SAM-dependent methyltransferase
MGDESTTACPICGSERTQVYRTDVRDLEYFVEPPRTFAVQRCSSCGSQSLAPRPTEAELPPFYPADYHAYNENHSGLARYLVRARARSRAKFYGSLIEQRPGHQFDVGSGDCRHFDELRKYIDIECAGIEIQPEIAAKGRAKGYDIVEGTLETSDLTGHFGTYDVVSMNHVLEHVVEPRTMLERSFELLKPGGHLVGQLPTVSSWEAQIFGRNWGGYHFPRHLQIPSRAGLAALLADVGFRDVHIRTAPHIQTTTSMQNTLIRWGWRPTMRYGKTPAHAVLMALSLPFESVAWLFDRGGIIDFRAHR